MCNIDVSPPPPLCPQLRFQNIVEVYTFMAINILAMAYASLQVYQFRGFGSECEKITLVGYLALANVSCENN